MPHADKMMLQIHAVMAEMERDFISMRTKAALAEAKARGVKLGGMRDKTMQRNIVLKQKAQDRAEALRGIIEPMVHADYTLAAIATALDEGGNPTARGGKWSAMQVSRIVERLAI